MAGDDSERSHNFRGRWRQPWQLQRLIPSLLEEEEEAEEAGRKGGREETEDDEEEQREDFLVLLCRISPPASATLTKSAGTIGAHRRCA